MLGQPRDARVCFSTGCYRPLDPAPRLGGGGMAVDPLWTLLSRGLVLLVVLGLLALIVRGTRRRGR
jgi:hypothetical protein